MRRFEIRKKDNDLEDIKWFLKKQQLNGT